MKIILDHLENSFLPCIQTEFRKTNVNICDWIVACELPPNDFWNSGEVLDYLVNNSNRLYQKTGGVNEAMSVASVRVRQQQHKQQPQSTENSVRNQNEGSLTVMVEDATMGGGI
jgi:hypothetical protein